MRGPIQDGRKLCTLPCGRTLSGPPATIFFSAYPRPVVTSPTLFEGAVAISRSMHYERTPRFSRMKLREVLVCAPDSGWLTSSFETVVLRNDSLTLGESRRWHE